VFRWLSPIDGLADLEKGFLERVPAPSRSSTDFLAQVFDYIEMLRFLKSSLAIGILRLAGREMDNIFALYRYIEVAAKLNAELPIKETVLDSYQHWNAPGLGMAMVVRYSSALLARGDTATVEEILKIVPNDVPSELQGSVIEAQHLENRALLASKSDDRMALVNESVRILQVLGQDRVARRLRPRVLAG
jgi:hypothetical protein